MNHRQRAAWAVLVVILAGICAGSCGVNEPANVVAEDELVLRYFDVKDLLPPVETLVGNPPFLHDPPGPPQARGSRDDPATLTEESLLAFIQEQTGTHTSWSDDVLGEGGSLEIRNRIVIARSTPAVLDLVVKVLDEIRASSDPLAHVEASR